MNRILVVLSVLALVAGSVPRRAQSSPSPAPLSPSEVPLPGMKSPSTALALSVMCTTVPLFTGIVASGSSSNDGDGSVAGSLLFTSGLLVGPSVGHFYAGRSGRALAGIGIRTVGTAGLVGAAAMAWSSGSNSGSGAVALASLAVLVYGVVFDIAAAPG